MKNIRKNKTLIRSVLSLILAGAMMLSYFAFPIGFLARAEDTNDEEINQFETVAVTVTNGQFANSSGTFPKSPSSWTGSFLSTDSGEIISGVIDLTSSSYTTNQDKYKLSEYPEYKKNRVPETIFGRPAKPNGIFPNYENTNSSVLMLNTNGISTTYKYTSSSISLAANSFYKISAWTKTGNFDTIGDNPNQESGAAIKLSGIEGRNIGFNNINTVRNIEKNSEGVPILSLEGNNFGWQEYSIYVSTNYRAQSVSLNLQIGDSGTDDDGNSFYHPTEGYAFFDNVTAYQLSPEAFEFETAVNSDNIFVADLNEAEYLTKNGKNIGSFDNALSGYPEGWTTIDEDGTGSAVISVYNPKTYIAENSFGLTENPYAPLGIDRAKGNNILVISSPSKNVAAGVKSPDILIKRNNYYRVAAWVKTQESDSGAAVAIKGPSEYLNQINVVSSSLYGDSTNLSRYGWKQESFYIKGSSIMDCTVFLELWLGQLEQTSKGIALFDDITIETLTQKEYNENVAEGNDVQIDGSLNDNTGISNGMFYTAGTYEEYAYPLPPSQWTMFDAVAAGTTGYGSNPVKTEDVVSGIIPIDTEHFNENRLNYLGASNPLPNEPNARNVLFMASEEKTAFCYRSEAFNISSGISKIYASLMTDNIDGYGANLVLKRGNNVLSTIEAIDTNGQFQTFEFFVEGHSANSNSLTLEIWLGLGDKDNRGKLSSGFVFVKEAGLTTSSEQFEDIVGLYKNSDSSNVASLNANYFINYKYSDNYLMESYDWTLDTSLHSKAKQENTDIGILNIDKIAGSPLGYANLSDFSLDDSGNTTIFFMQNKVANAATATYSTSQSLTEGLYYSVSVSMKVDIPEQFLLDNPEAVGASIGLRGTEYVFEDIKDSRTTVDSEFKTYTFYVRCNETTPSNISFDITLGGYENSKEFCLGQVYVSNIEVKEITKPFYDATVKQIDDDSVYAINADLTTATEDTTTPPTSDDDEDKESWWKDNWYVIPSFIFGLTLVAILVFVLGRWIFQRLPKRKKTVKVKEYDRTKSLEKANMTSVEEEATVEVPFDEFDDDIDMPATPAKTKAKEVEKETVEETPVETTKTDETSEITESDEASETDDSTTSSESNMSEFDE